MKYFLTLIICILILGCSNKKNEQSINGYWMQEGYGAYLEITDSIYKMYDVTEISCQPSASGSIANWTDDLNILLDLYTVSNVTADSMVLKYGITSYKFKKLSEPLELCEKPIVASTDPKLNFDIFWHTFKENYAYSKIRNVDWNAIYEKHEPLISEETTQVELFGYIGEILDGIQDQHISLKVPDSILNAYMAIRMPTDQSTETNSPNDQEAIVEEKQEYGNPRLLAMSKIIELFPKTNFKTFHKDLVLWGSLNSKIGYLQINSMNGFSEKIKLEESLEHDEYWEKHWERVFGAIENGMTLGQYLNEEVNGAKAIKNMVLNDFMNTSGVVIDLRFNPGGTDKVALELLSGFTDGGQNVFTKKVWYKDQNVYSSLVYIPKTTDNYLGKVVVLTSSQTGSSAETFVLATRKLKNFTQVGSNTMGIFSDVLQKKLPNGWNYGLSNEIYETDNGKNYEYVGIPPDYNIDYSRDWYQFHSSIAELEGKDPVINLALEVLVKE